MQDETDNNCCYNQDQADQRYNKLRFGPEPICLLKTPLALALLQLLAGCKLHARNKPVEKTGIASEPGNSFPKLLINRMLGQIPTPDIIKAGKLPLMLRKAGRMLFVPQCLTLSVSYFRETDATLIRVCLDEKMAHKATSFTNLELKTHRGGIISPSALRAICLHENDTRKDRKRTPGQAGVLERED